MTFAQLLHDHYVIIGMVAWFLFTSAVNALPNTGESFVFGVWFPAFLREIAQQAPARFPSLTPAQKELLAAHPEVK